jgi:hypothetical protein
LPARILSATGTGGAGAITTVIADSGDFGPVCLGSFEDLDLTISNGGTCNLSVTAISSSSPDFLPPSTLSYPLVIQAGTSVHVPIRFAATTAGAHSANITINSDDPITPSAVVAVSGTAPLPTATTSGALDFGQLCEGDSKTVTVQLCDTGKCDLVVTGAALTGPNCAGFTLVSPSPSALPLTISPDFCFGFVVKFSPTSLATPDCSLVITTNDPAHATVTFPITATVGAPHLVLDPTSLNGIYAFPATVVDPNGTLGCFSDRSVVVRNAGTCPLHISAITATAPFHVIAPTHFPIVLPVGEENAHAWCAVRADVRRRFTNLTRPDDGHRHDHKR